MLHITRCPRRTHNWSLVSFFFFLSLAVSPLGVRADEDTPAPLPTEEAFLGELPIVLSVTRLPQSRAETPAAVTVIDRDMIRATGARHVADLFWLVPGFQVGYARATTPTVAYHGFSDEFARRMQVLIDGRSVYNVLWGGVNWHDLPLAIEDIERIEVIRGPNAAAYGSNAFLGVINIITRHASQDPGTYAGVAVGEHRVRDAVARQTWGAPQSSSRITAAYTKEDGFDTLPDSFETAMLSFRGDYRLKAGNELELQLGGSTGKRGEGRESDATDRPRDSEVASNFQLLRWRHLVSTDNEVSIQFYHNYWKSRDRYETAPVNLGSPFGVVAVPVNLDGTEERYDIELQHVSSLGQDWRLVWGGGARLDQARSQTFFDTGETLKNGVYRVFGNAEYHLSPDSIVNAGAMWEKNSISGADTSPRLALNQRLAPNHTLRVVASEATRIPTLLDERGDTQFRYQGIVLEQTILSRGGLTAETMRSFELGYLAETAAKELSLDVRLFRDRLRNLITEVKVPVVDRNMQAFDYRNEGEIDIWGGDLQITYRPAPATQLVFSYASMHADASGFSAEANFNEQEHEQSVPADTANLLAMHRFAGRWEASVNYHKVADMLWLGSGGFVTSNGRLDARLAYLIRSGRVRGQVAIVVQNLGPDSVSFDTENVFDRRTYLTVSVSH
jgi:iron complex outermembrane recepter protein